VIPEAVPKRTMIVIKESHRKGRSKSPVPSIVEGKSRTGSFVLGYRK
jgi:hypothetical protein